MTPWQTQLSNPCQGDVVDDVVAEAFAPSAVVDGALEKAAPIPHYLQEDGQVQAHLEGSTEPELHWR